MGMVYKVLSQTPADENGFVPGTPFTCAGVARLMTMLVERTGNEAAPGAKAATSALAFLSATETDAETGAVAGASVDKLQVLARKIEGIKSGRGGGSF